VRTVHKNPPLDLVGWYSLVPKTGPTRYHLPIQRQISAVNDSAILLGFHVEDIINPAPGDPLPITIYETLMEAEESRENDGEDREMMDVEAAAKMVLRFRKLPYVTDTGEAEMIALKYIREGGANATAEPSDRSMVEQFEKKIAVDDGKGKRRAVAYEESSQAKKEASSSATNTPTNEQQQQSNPDVNLNREETEYMSALQAKYNAIKMMKSRLALVIAYLAQLPPAFKQGYQTTANAAADARATHGVHTIPSNTILRQLQALLTNADLVTPSTTSPSDSQPSALAQELQREANDVQLISLVSDLLSSVSEIREAGKKFSVLEVARMQRQMGRADPRDGGGGFGDMEFDPRMLLGGRRGGGGFGGMEGVGGPGVGSSSAAAAII